MHLRVEILVVGSTSQSFSMATGVNVPTSRPLWSVLTPQSALVLKLHEQAAGGAIIKRGEMWPGAVWRYRKRSAKSERMKGKRLLDRGEVGHLREGLGELDASLGVDVVRGEAVGDKASHVKGDTGSIKVVAGGALESRDCGVGQHFAELLDGGERECAAAYAVDAAELAVVQAAARGHGGVRQADTGRYQGRVV